MHTPIVDQIVKRVETLTEEKQIQVLEYAEGLVMPRPSGTPIADLLQFAGTIPEDDIELMLRVIEEDCERIDPDEW